MSSTERIPYCKQTLGEEEIAAVTEVLRSGWIVRGPLAKQLEERVASRVHASHAISCCNGSAAIEIALRGLGIGPGDEVVVPTLTWVSTASAVRLVGATPVFCDVDPDTHNVTPETVLAAWTPNTKAVVAVDLCGVPCDVRALRELTQSKGAALISDAAHSFGATHEDGTPVGADGYADITTFSFHPAKTITTGEGGMLTCQDAELGERLRRIRSGGMTREFEGSRGGFDFEVVDIGSNYHLSEIHAAIGLVQLGRMDEFLAARKSLAQEMTEQLKPLAHKLRLPEHPDGSSWNLYVVELVGDAESSTERDELIKSLNEAGVAAHLHYPLLHKQPIFDSGGSLSNAERYERRALTLPLFPELTKSQIERVANALEQALALPRATV